MTLKFLLVLLKAGPSVSVTDNTLMDTGLSWGSSTNHERQSAGLLHAPEIHSNVMLYVANSSPHLLTLLFHIFSITKFVKWLVIIAHYDVSSLEIIIPFGNGIIYSLSFLLSGAPFSLCFQKGVQKEGNRKFRTIMFLGKLHSTGII